MRNLQVNMNKPAALEYLDCLLGSHLYTAAEQRRLRDVVTMGDETQAQTLLDKLLRRGRVTTYQLDKLRAGAGKHLFLGPFRLLAPIGRGGMGLVYLAEHGKSGELCALKVLPPKRSHAEPRMLLRFQREIEMGVLVPKHEALMQPLGHGRSRGIHYLAAEYIHGRTLKQILRAEGPLPMGVAARLFAELAEGLAALHRVGIVHRDLKPGNIIMTANGYGKWIDYGLACRVTDVDMNADPTNFGGKGYTVGTMDYLPPEQARNAATVGPQADIYALGCCLYVALTGESPFPKGTAQEKIEHHLKSDFPDIHFVNPTIPSEIAQLLFWMTKKKPAQRPQDAAEIAAMLQPWAAPPSKTLAAITRAEIITTIDARYRQRRSLAEAVVTAARDAEPVVTVDVRRLYFMKWYQVLLFVVLVTISVVLSFAVGYAVGS